MLANSIKRAVLIFGALLLGLFAYTPYEAVADTDVTVDDTRDVSDVSPNFGPDCKSRFGTCTLRAAIQRGNHQIGTHTIRLPAGNYPFSIAGRGEDEADTGDLDIKGKFIIIGAGAKSTIINGNNLDRVFDVRSGSLILQDLAVRGGFAQNDDGGGIRAKAPLTLNRVHLASNVADRSGGGIYTEDDLSIVRSTISLNVANASLGVSAIDGAFTGVIRRNVSIRESTIGENICLVCSAIQFSGEANIEILHSTIAKNHVDAPRVSPRGLEIVNFPIIAPNLTIDHTIFDQKGGAGQNCFIVGTFTTSFTRNVDSDGSCGFSFPANLVLVDPMLGPLQDNGGQTPTFAFANPVLLDRLGLAPNCAGVDQRGFPRPVDFNNDDGEARCDIGAIELQGPVGIAVLEPETATVRKDKPFHLSYLWRVPPDQNWHDLETLDLRVVDGDKDDKGRNHGHDDEVIFWVRWSEAGNTFQLINPRTGHPHGRAFPAGSNHVLETEDVLLDVRNSSSEGSGPTGQEVTLRLALIFHEKSERDEPFTIEVTAADDHGQTQPFLAPGSVAVGPSKRH
jgi:predicted outer membrane repeat protein